MGCEVAPAVTTGVRGQKEQKGQQGLCSASTALKKSKNWASLWESEWDPTEGNRQHRSWHGGPDSWGCPALLAGPGPDAKDQNRRGTHSITHRRGRQALVPQAGHCTNPYIQPGEVTGVRAVPHVVAKKHDGKIWVLGPGIQSLSEAHGCASCSLKGVPGLSGWALCVLGRGGRGG